MNGAGLLHEPDQTLHAQVGPHATLASWDWAPGPCIASARCPVLKGLWGPAPLLPRLPTHRDQAPYHPIQLLTNLWEALWAG